MVNFGCSRGQRVPCPRCRACLGSLGPPCRRPGGEVGLRLLPGECGTHCLGAVPRTWTWGWDQSEEKPKGSQTPQPFWQGLSSLGLGDPVFSAEGAAPVYEAAAPGSQAGCRSQQRGWDHFARLAFPGRTFWLNSRRAVSYLTEALPQKAWMGWVRGSPAPRP